MCIKKAVEKGFNAGRYKMTGKGSRLVSMAFYMHNKGILKDNIKKNNKTRSVK